MRIVRLSSPKRSQCEHYQNSYILHLEAPSKCEKTENDRRKEIFKNMESWALSNSFPDCVFSLLMNITSSTYL